MNRQNVQMKSLSCSKKHAQAHNSWFSFQFSGRKKALRWIEFFGEILFHYQDWFWNWFKNRVTVWNGTHKTSVIPSRSQESEPFHFKHRMCAPMSTNLIKLVCWIDAYIHFPVRRLWNIHFMTTFILISHCFIFLIELYGYPISLWLSFRLKAIKLVLIPSSNISKYFGFIYRISIYSQHSGMDHR